MDNFGKLLLLTTAFMALSAGGMQRDLEPPSLRLKDYDSKVQLRIAPGTQTTLRKHRKPNNEWVSKAHQQLDLSVNHRDPLLLIAPLRTK
ncbi:MAG: hypothetical protein LBJ70_00840 [Holosporales bacterium]|jgi:hypothetical protein|nr:hypothetical protein [Holosporales bacterium]